VETEAQWHYLKSRHADQVQGFLFCRPLAIDDLERWHEEWLHSHQPQSASVA
jgi:EAL domain-containing protein (putative c-di-GMP-specific phosphodiesterase class I)